MDFIFFRVIVLSLVLAHVPYLVSMETKKDSSNSLEITSSDEEQEMIFSLELDETPEAIIYIGGVFGDKKTKVYKDQDYDLDGYTNCHRAILEKNCTTLTKILRPRRDDWIDKRLLNKKSSEGLTPLAFAVWRSEILCVNELLLDHALVDEIDDDGDTALMILLASDSWSETKYGILRMLICVGADYEKIKNKNNKTALDIADEKGRASLLKEALKK